MDLHWLKIKVRITYKIATLVYKCKHGMAPSYLQDILPDRPHSLSLRLVTANKMTIYSAKTCKYEMQISALSAPGHGTICMPPSVTGAGTFGKFKKRLKLHLFTLSYDVLSASARKDLIWFFKESLYKSISININIFFGLVFILESETYFQCGPATPFGGKIT